MSSGDNPSDPAGAIRRTGAADVEAARLLLASIDRAVFAGSPEVPFPEQATLIRMAVVRLFRRGR
jgi:hypothetical protein